MTALKPSEGASDMHALGPTDIGAAGEAKGRELQQWRREDIARLDGTLGEMEASHPGIASRLIALYRSSALRSVRQITMGVTETDHRKIGAAAHSLNSASATVGALAVADLARRIEHMARISEPISVIEALSQELEVAWRETERALGDTTFQG